MKLNQVPATPHHPAYQHPVQQPVQLNYGGYPVPPRDAQWTGQATVNGPVHTKRKQSVKVHLLLLCVAPVIGNILYAKWCNSATMSKFKA